MSEISHFRTTMMTLPGKGGIGKTWFSSSVAFLLSRRFNTALLDVDIITPNIMQVMGLAGTEPKFNLSKRKQRAFVLNDRLRIYSLESFFEDNSAIRLDVHECERLILECLEDIDWGPKPIEILICDMPPAQSDPIKALHLLFPKTLSGIGITSPTKLSMDNLERTLYDCYTSRIKVLGVIANMVGAEMHGHTPRCGCGCGDPFYPNSDRGDGSEVREFTERMKCDFLGVIKYDPDLGFNANLEGPAIINNGAIGNAVEKIAGSRRMWDKIRGG